MLSHKEIVSSIKEKKNQIIVSDQMIIKLEITPIKKLKVFL